MREHVDIVGGREQRVRDHRHDARVERAEEGNRQRNGIEHDEQYALFGMHAERAQCAREAPRAFLEFTVGGAAGVVDIGGFGGACFVQPKQVGREIE